MLAHADELLRSNERHAPSVRVTPWLPIVALVVCGSLVYGAVMGTWSTRPLQVVVSGLKVPLLLAGTTLVCLPNFFVLNTILGLRDDFGAALRGVLTAQATLALVLAGLAPLTGFVYLAGCSYPMATLTNGAAFLTATLGGQWTLARHYRRLIERDPKHRICLIAWIILYQFVAIQLAWSLRPFIGSPDLETMFFRPDSWTNAYVDAVRAMQSAVGR